ncbi:MAG: redoxin domain-containing protein [Clostridiales bacterium]|nr:redoxin domain-containing protein [Clostridiales bacterium]
MFQGFDMSNSVSLLLVFIEGLISFFSPCVIPLIPVYMGYLAGSGKRVNEDGTIIYNRKNVFLHTIFFNLGVSFAFFILGMTFTALGKFFGDYKLIFTKVGGILIILLGLFQLGIFNFSFLQRERKIIFDLGNREMNPFVALIMGFTFSFAWTPCIGPALSSVLIMASGAKTSLQGNLLVLVYAIGFLIPFLLLGLFTTQVLNFLKENRKLMKYTIKVGAIILIIMGLMTFTGRMNNISSYFNSLSNNKNNSKNLADNSGDKDKGEVDGIGNSENTDNSGDTNNSDDIDKTEDEVEREPVPAFDFTLTDQYGKEHTLSDYKGKVVFLNFWATWCPPCRYEMPDIEELYKEYNLNQDEVIFLGVANPKSEEYPYNQDEEKDEIIAFLDENEYTFPTVFDETGEVFRDYYVYSFPTTFLIDKEGNIFGYQIGMMSKDLMQKAINMTLEASE